MSGGVDSSVTACLLKDQGYDVIGIHMHFWTDPTVFSAEDSEKFPQNKCCTLEGLSRARSMTHRLGIPFYVVNFEEPFKTHVVDFFVDGYSRGITPNPCVECNRNIKFGLFLKKMQELGADYVATGHYARKVTVKSGDSRKNNPGSEHHELWTTKDQNAENGGEKYELWTAKDQKKDQSYFLYVLTQEKLKHILFPLGDYTKPEVRELAKKYGIEEINKQKESQNLCFFPERQHGDFLKRYLQKQQFESGPIVTTAGQKIGTHQGLPLYTIGQRKGLGIGGVKGFEDQDGWYVVKIDKENNALVVGKREELFQNKFQAENLTFIAGVPPVANGPIIVGAKPIAAGANSTESVANPAEVTGITARIRYHAELSPAKVTFIPDKKNPQNLIAQVELERPQAAITPGQSVVFYEGEKVLGGGIITSQS